jgi:hypothetical protein
MAILVLFNDAPTRTLTEIKSATNIEDGELRRNLISLCTPKHRILKKSSKGKSIEDDDKFTCVRCPRGAERPGRAERAGVACERPNDLPSLVRAERAGVAGEI